MGNRQQQVPQSRAGRVNYAAAYPGGREALIEVISEFRGHGRGVVPYGLGRGVDDAVI